MPEVKIYEGVDYKWGWDLPAQERIPKIALHITDVGMEKLVAVFGSKARQVNMTVVTGDGPDYVLVTA